MADDFTDGDLEHLIDQRVDAKLAALGGHLTKTYGHSVTAGGQTPEDTHDAALATLGGFLLEHSGEEGIPWRVGEAQ